MTGSKSKNTINQMKFFFSRAKFRAFTDAMLANDEQEWNIFKSRNEDFFVNRTTRSLLRIFVFLLPLSPMKRGRP